MVDWRTFIYRLRSRFSNLHGFMDWVWAIFTVINFVAFANAAVHLDVVNALISGFLLYVCVYPLLRY